MVGRRKQSQSRPQDKGRLNQTKNRRKQTHMQSFNKITIIGNLGADPELRYTPQGTPVVSFSVCSNERRKDRATGEFVDNPTWFKATTYGNSAEAISKHLQRGSKVYVEGRLSVDDWVGREGDKRYTLVVNTTDVKFMDKMNGNGGGGAAAETEAQAEAVGDAEGDDKVPF